MKYGMLTIKRPEIKRIPNNRFTFNPEILKLKAITINIILIAIVIKAVFKWILFNLNMQ